MTTTAKGKDKVAGKGKGKKLVQPEVDIELEDAEMLEEGDEDNEAEEEVIAPVKKGKKKVAHKVVEEETTEQATKAPTANEKRLQRKLDTVRFLSILTNHNIRLTGMRNRSLSPSQNKQRPLNNSKNSARRKLKNQKKP